MFPGIETIQEGFMIAKAAASKSNDLDTQVGAVLIQRWPGGRLKVIGVGHNWIVTHGDPALLQRPAKYPASIHAELAAIGAAAAQGEATGGAILYSTHPPCQECAKVIWATGIDTIIVGPGEYFSNSAENLANAAHLFKDRILVLTEHESWSVDLSGPDDSGIGMSEGA